MTAPTHPKAPLYLQRGIFDGLKNVRELEARISALATTKERGDAFEVFAEAYLATVAVEKAKQVWPGASVPPSVRKRLALTIGDNGVDGIFETPLGETHAYQAKFRTGRPSLALLGQTLHEWARATSWPALAHLCVCSDPAVQAGTDEIILRSSDLDFPVTTDSARVREFLAARYDGVKLVFSTYQSAHVVAAGLPPGAKASTSALLSATPIVKLASKFRPPSIAARCPAGAGAFKPRYQWRPQDRSMGTRSRP